MEPCLDSRGFYIYRKDAFLPLLLRQTLRFNLKLCFVYGGINLGQVKYVKETLPRDRYACEMNFDSLARLYLFSGYSLIT